MKFLQNIHSIKNTIARPVLLMLLWIGFAQVWSQDVVVKNTDTQKPVEDCFVFRSHKFIGITNFEGLVSLKEISSNTTIITFNKFGFETLETSLDKLKQQNYQVTLKPLFTNIDQIVVSVTNFETERANLPQKVTLLSPKNLPLTGVQTAPDMLSNSGEVFVQKSQAGGGSPVLRGLEANKILLMLDGIRLNTQITRGGHVQKALGVDNQSLKNTEILFGPGSVNFGSDAIGGIINFYTKNPDSLPQDKKYGITHVASSVRYSSVNNEQTVHSDIGYGVGKLSFLTSFTHSGFGEMRIGKNRYFTPEASNDQWGRQLRYVVNDPTAQQDNFLDNTDPNTLKYSGFQQANFIQKVNWKPSSNLKLNYTYYLINTSDVNRLDQLSRTSGSKPKFAEWFYGKQNHHIHAVELNYSKPTTLFDSWKTCFATQNFTESRNTRGFQNNIRLRQEERVHTFSAKTSFDKKLSHRNTLSYGYQFMTNQVKSVGTETNIYTGETSAGLSRFPNKNNVFFSNAWYMLDRYRLNDKISLLSGIRFESMTNASSYLSTKDQLLTGFLPKSIRFQNKAITGHFGANYTYKSYKVTTQISKGFRSPNLDDFGKVRAKNGRILLPTANLKPERAYCYEISAERLKGDFHFGLNSYYTWLLNAISAQNGTLNGRDSILYEGEMNQVQFNTNSGYAYITGVGSWIQFKRNLFTVKGTANYTYGFDVANQAPMGHIAPVFGNVLLKYGNDKFSQMLMVRFNGTKKQSLYAPNGSDNLEYATENGTPAWWTLNYYLSAEKQGFRLSGGIENILDVHYRPFSSGVSGMGRNFVLQLSYEI